MRRRNDGTDLTSTVRRAWAELRESEARKRKNIDLLADPITHEVRYVGVREYAYPEPVKAWIASLHPREPIRAHLEAAEDEAAALAIVKKWRGWFAKSPLLA
jgi:hypothetical protein